MCCRDQLPGIQVPVYLLNGRICSLHLLCESLDLPIRQDEAFAAQHEKPPSRQLCAGRIQLVWMDTPVINIVKLCPVQRKSRFSMLSPGPREPA